MDVRSVQRTGKMHYVYLPTSWCKRHAVTSDTNLALVENIDGSLTVRPDEVEKSPVELEFKLASKHRDVLVNLIMACYVNPIDAFRITLDSKEGMQAMLEQKKLLAALDFVELDGEHVTYESGLARHDPDALLKTMLKKAKNLLFVMLESPSKDLIARYEEEIDRTKILIQKSVISSLVLSESRKLKPIEMYYTVQLATELERIIDMVIELPATEKAFLGKIAGAIERLKELLEAGPSYEAAVAFTTEARALPEPQPKDTASFRKFRIHKQFVTLSETVMDWAVTNAIESKENP